jgi:hypothetical protein
MRRRGAPKYDGDQRQHAAHADVLAAIASS